MSIKTEVEKLRNNIKTVSNNLKERGFNVPNETMQGLIDATTKKWYEYDDWYNRTNEATIDDIGVECETTVNGVVHKVRLIDIDHDDLADGSGKAHCTFQFVNILSDSNGYSTASYWEDTSRIDSLNRDYPNSSIRKALDGDGSGYCHWFEKDSKTFSTTYTGSVLSMLPADLQAALKTVIKQVAIGSTGYTYILTDYNTKLFQLSYREMTTGSSSYAKEEGTTYTYWKNHDSSADRIIKQIKGCDGARTEELSGKDLDGSSIATKYSYAGYNNSTAGNGGAIWLRSPYIDSGGTANRAWIVNYNGDLYNRTAYNYACGVAPAFCI